MFLFKTHQKEAEYISAIEWNDSQIAGAIKTFDIEEIFRKSNLQWVQNLKFEFERNQLYYYFDVLEYNGEVEIKSLNEVEGKKAILSLALDIINGYDQKVIIFLDFLIFNSKVYQCSLFMDRKLINFITLKESKNDEILITTKFIKKP
jgi:hypothetical protein